MIRYYLDEHIATAVAEGLRQHGIDVLRAQDAGMTGAEDDEHLAFAHQHGRVMVTQDDDYLVLAHNGTRHSGIAFITQQRLGIGTIVRALLVIHRRRPHMDGAIEFVP